MLNKFHKILFDIPDYKDIYERFKASGQSFSYRFTYRDSRHTVTERVAKEEFLSHTFMINRTEADPPYRYSSIMLSVGIAGRSNSYIQVMDSVRGDAADSPFALSIAEEMLNGLNQSK